MLSALFKKFFRGGPSPVLAPAASVGSSTPSSFSVDVLLSKIEAKDPGILHLYGLGDGFLWMNEGLNC
jgi:hypothetical protein